MSGRALSDEELAELPVFPLPRVVFFPGSILPLHLFEPRYRELVEHCMSHGPQAMAVALLKPGYEADYDGSPEFERIAGVGRIVEHERQADGTHNVILQGVARVTLGELPSKPRRAFRCARATVIKDEGSVAQSELRTLLSCATSVAAVVRAQHPDFELGIRSDDSASALIDTIADRFVADTTERQSILEASPLPLRLERTLGVVSELYAALANHELPS